jgi:ubiquinone/menaquinone biosynthesis C-methylase UbiE
MRWFGWFRKKQPNQAGAMQALDLQDGVPVAVVAGRLRTVGLPYALPRDVEEINRLDFQHYMMRYAFQGLYAAPIGQPPKILDVGTGTGRWAREMAQLFPHSQVVGIDVTPPPADEQVGAGADMRPPNYAFAAGNVFEGIPFSDGSFDFVHMRLLFTAIPADRWQSVINELGRVVRPGGWVESVESGNLLNGGPAVAMVLTWLNQVMARRGVIIDAGNHVAEMLPAAGLANIHTQTINIPTGAYGGRLGTMMAQDLFSAFSSLGGFVVNSGLASKEEFDGMMQEFRAELNAPECQCITPFFICYGQRPG